MFELDSVMHKVLQGLYFKDYALYYTNAHCFRGNLKIIDCTNVGYSGVFSSAQTESTKVGKTKTHKAYVQGAA